MENIIQELINIENKADETIAETLAQRNNLSEMIKQRVNEINEEIEKETEEKISRMYQSSYDESTSLIQQIRADSQNSFSQLEREFGEHRSRWAEEIYQKIIGR